MLCCCLMFFSACLHGSKDVKDTQTREFISGLRDIANIQQRFRGNCIPWDIRNRAAITGHTTRWTSPSGMQVNQITTVAARSVSIFGRTTITCGMIRGAAVNSALFAKIAMHLNTFLGTIFNCCNLKMPSRNLSYFILCYLVRPGRDENDDGTWWWKMRK